MPNNRTLRLKATVLLRAIISQWRQLASEARWLFSCNCENTKFAASIYDYCGIERRSDDRTRLDVLEIGDGVACGLATPYEGEFALRGLGVSEVAAKRILTGGK